MKELFQLPVAYKGETLLLQAELQSWGFGQRVIVQVNNEPVRFEHDSNRNYHAIVAPGRLMASAGLLACIIETLEYAFK